MQIQVYMLHKCFLTSACTFANTLDSGRARTCAICSIVLGDEGEEVELVYAENFWLGVGGYFLKTER